MPNWVNLDALIPREDFEAIDSGGSLNRPPSRVRSALRIYFRTVSAIAFCESQISSAKQPTGRQRK